MKSLGVLICFLLNLFVYGQTVTSGLVGYYPFDMDVLDYSGNDYHGNSNSISYSSGFNINSDYSVDFSLSDSYINYGDVDDFEGSDVFSVSFWMNGDSTGGGVGSEVLPIMTDWFTSTLPDSCSWGLFIIDDSLQFNVSDGVSFDQSRFNLSLQSDVWQHHVLTFNQGVVKYYVDGLFISADTLNTSTIHDSNTHFKIGDWRSQDLAGYLTFYGFLDEVLLYRRELSGEEVILIYQDYTSFASFSNKQDHVLKVYPVPASSVLNIQFDGVVESFQLFSVNGSLIKQFETTSNVLNLEGISKGQYYLEVHSKKEVVRQKIVIE